MCLITAVPRTPHCNQWNTLTKLRVFKLKAVPCVALRCVTLRQPAWTFSIGATDDVILFFVTQMIAGLLCITRAVTAVKKSSVPSVYPRVRRRASAIRSAPVSTIIPSPRSATCTDRGLGTTSASWAESRTTTTHAEVRITVHSHIASLAHFNLAIDRFSNSACFGIIIRHLFWHLPFLEVWLIQRMCSDHVIAIVVKTSVRINAVIWWCASFYIFVTLARKCPSIPVLGFRRFDSK